MVCNEYASSYLYPYLPLMNGRSFPRGGLTNAQGAMAAGGRGKPAPNPAKHSPTTPKDHPLGIGMRNTLSPGEIPVQRPRRLSAPCGPQQCSSAPSSPAHRPASPRATSPCGPRSDVGQGGKMSSDAWVCPNDRQLALRAK